MEGDLKEEDLNVRRLMEANLNRIDATSMVVDLMEDDHHGRQPPRQTNSAEEGFKGREAKSKN